MVQLSMILRRISREPSPVVNKGIRKGVIASAGQQLEYSQNRSIPLRAKSKAEEGLTQSRKAAKKGKGAKGQRGNVRGHDLGFIDSN